ncbi:competence protein CoiA family protein [Treponema saccharophilum]|uniref:DNA 3'-5' helicase n=1 Tax=Treponema saccharophilum DSM 2985 TaxID=907348 RepID=H7EPV3_9SPIR|nr:competence protein CoiA family protein [Treponema saccharophilum]EIC00504.1 UvrD/REP helicase [Treponema saccharophilum DSM 2985]BDC95039.1 hypothetical protein TRSA_01380 [Treponema saccharophilum]
MYIAFDSNFSRVHIDDCVIREKYFCPYCKSPLVVRKGDVRRHHFAHEKYALCSDSWSYDRIANDSDWHRKWQEKFPIDNQEICLTLGEIKHRADVMVLRTVLEFQHSPLSSEKFSNRNSFYSELGNKVIWVFDYQDVKFSVNEENDDINVIWNQPKHTFDTFTDADRFDGVEVYFQISESELWRIKKISEKGFENFLAKKVSVSDFLASLKDSNGNYPNPEHKDLKQNIAYLDFKKKYNITLNPQQERAVQTVTGANLLLAVPGSGKTTVLIARIGYMVICRHISPLSILALTYTTKAASEMKKRAVDLFGDIVKGVSFKTINAFSYEVLKYYENSSFSKKKMFGIIDENDRTKLLRAIFLEINTDKEFPTEDVIKQLSVDITRMKNGIDIESMKSLVPNFKQIYERYNDSLKNIKRMDFDDQIRYAVSVLKKHLEILNYCKNRYPYICVDEAQDTSKKQHELLHLISGDHIFMVGDEDQSIYSFRGAFPRALTNFENIYRNPYILRMEVNYRSNSEITDLANRFVARNSMRHKKSIISSRGKGGSVKLISYNNRDEEYQKIYSRFCCNINEDTAILYRDSDCGICLIAMLFENNIPFRLLQNSTTFFTNKFVSDVDNFIKLATNPYDTETFLKIYYKIPDAKYKKEAAQNIAKYARNTRKTVLEAICGSYNRKGYKFADHIEYIAQIADKPADVVEYIHEITENKDEMAYSVLKNLANHIKHISEFGNYRTFLKDKIKDCSENPNKESLLTLSTIHSAKGLEFKNVIILDVNDHFIPHVAPYDIEEDEEKKDLYQEERRLFYVAMTRAKDNLYIAHVKEESSYFVNELKRISGLTVNQKRP